MPPNVLSFWLVSRYMTQKLLGHFPLEVYWAHPSSFRFLGVCVGGNMAERLYISQALEKPQDHPAAEKCLCGEGTYEPPDNKP